jgi:ABC-type phosphate transport system substrate-binding protein
MFSRTRKKQVFTARAGALAAVSAALLAVAGVGASGASAAECGSGTPANIQGSGVPSQRIAMGEWTGREAPVGEPLVSVPHPLLIPQRGYAKECPSGTTVSFTSLPTGNALTAFRFQGAGAIQNGSPESEFGRAFVGLDYGPNATQIEDAEKATTGGVATGANPLIIPVAETTIAVPVHLPSGCTFNSEKGLTYAALNAIFAGTIKKWSEVPNLTGGASCESEITRVLPAEGSGTTYQFKNYLQILQTGHSGSAPGCGVSNWSELEEIGAGERPNISWPECEGRTPIVSRSAEYGVVEYITKTPSTIGFATLPVAKTQFVTLARLQDKAGATPVYALPEAETGEKSNCGTRVYSVPTPGRVGESGESVNWSQVFGAAAEAGGELYPLCALTYDIAWSSYEKASYSSATNIAQDVKKYMNYVLGNEGQAMLNMRYFQKLPSPIAPAENVLGAALLAVTKIG